VFELAEAWLCSAGPDIVSSDGTLLTCLGAQAMQHWAPPHARAFATYFDARRLCAHMEAGEFRCLAAVLDVLHSLTAAEGQVAPAYLAELHAAVAAHWERAVDQQLVSHNAGS